jgi:ADP-heptose:LPS heptosyltransferase
MVRRIAVFRALYLGDMLCIIPTIRAVRHAYPAAEIVLIGLPWQKDFVRRFNHYFDGFIEFPGWPGLPEQPFNRELTLRFLRNIATHNFDLVLQMQGNGELTNSLCMLWNGKKVCGLRKPGEYGPEPDFFPVSEDGEHEVLRFLKLLDCLGIESQGTHLEFPVSREENVRANEMLDTASLPLEKFICIHPGARDKRRRWPVEHFAFIANNLATHGYSAILTGSGEEKEVLHELGQAIHAPALNIVEAFGHVGMGELAAILRRSRLLVSNDTGVSHIAAALQVPSVIVFSPFSDYNRWRPLDVSRHIAIPFDKASDAAYVLNRIVAFLANDDAVLHTSPRRVTEGDGL